jgi:hypothetical protein
MKTRFHIDDAFPFKEALRESWDPFLVRTPRVLVPIVVDALVSTGKEERWADCRMQAPPEAGEEQAPTDARSLMPDPFTDLPEPRPAGVHLHWALPDGLTKGTVATDGAGEPDVSLPAVPDRWLVLRLSNGADRRRRAVAGWVLEAGGPEPNVVALDDWRGPGSTGGVEQPLTAMGHGDPAWAAYYDNVENRLAFHDRAEDVAGRVAYLVCGWYADPALDPLGTNITSLAAFEQTLERLGWSLQGQLQKSQTKSRWFIKEAVRLGLRAKDRAWADHTSRRDADGNFVTSGDWWPSSTLFHGAAVDISLDGRALGGPPPADSLRVAFGATGGEALAALMATAGAGAEEERVVEALQLGVLHELDQPDGRARLDALLHASAFGSMSGGPDETEQIWEPAVPAQPDAPARPGKPDPGVFGNRRSSGLGGVTGRTAITPEIAEARGVAGPLTGTASHKVVGAKAVIGRLHDVRGVLEEVLVEGVRGEPRSSRPTPRPGRWVEVKRPQPRFHHPVDPVVLVQGGKRSFKHGGDGRLSDDDKLPCRLSGFTVTAISADLGGDRPTHGTLTGRQLVERGVDNGGVPAECTDVLYETVLLDPGSAGAAIDQLLGGGGGRGREVPDRFHVRVSQNWQVEQTAWWVLNDPRVDPAPVLTRSGVTGTLPSPIAITPPHRPWNPLHLDWEVEFTPSDKGIAEWELGEVDFERADSDGEGAEEATLEPVVVSGRALVTPGAVRTLAEAARAAIEAAARSGGADVLPPKVRTQYPSTTAKVLFEHLSGTSVRIADAVREAGDPRADLSSIVELLDRMDVLGGALDGFHLELRKGAPAVRPLLPDGRPDPSPITPLPGFVSMRAGTLTVTALRLVDGFGQYVDLADSTAAERIVLGESVRHDDAPGRAVLTPRFTAPSRLLLRWTDAASDTVGPGANPVCGYVLPDHLDGGLEFFAADGTNLGNLRADDHVDRLGSLLWEDAPGSPTTVGRPPGLDVANRFLRGIADGLLDWGMSDHGTRPGGSATEEGALEALLRVIDSTMWTVDLFGHAGDEHLALLVGHPVVVMRAVMRLETVDPAAPPELAWTPVPVRLGALTHWQDGLLAFYVNDDYGAVHCAPAAAAMAREVGARRGFLQQAPAVPGFYEHFEADLAGGADTGDSPVTHPYVSPDDVIMVRPNQDVRLTMLVEPHTLVHATTGMLPRKDIGMRREWMATALASLAPTFRFGPVLRDPDTLRMPIATDIAGTWTWNYKADVARWVEEQILNASHDAFLDDTPAEGTEGWLRLTPLPPPAAPPGQPPPPPRGTR